MHEAIFLAAEQARRTDPTLAARYHRLMVEAGKHHNSALCNVASTLLTRIVACWRSGQHYVIRDLDGMAVDVAQGRRIVQERYTVPSELRATRRTGGRREGGEGTDRRSQGSRRAPSTGPSPVHARSPIRA